MSGARLKDDLILMAKKSCNAADPIKYYKTRIAAIKRQKKLMTDKAYIKDVMLGDFTHHVYQMFEFPIQYVPASVGAILDQVATYEYKGVREGYLNVVHPGELSLKRYEDGEWTIYFPIPDMDYKEEFYNTVEQKAKDNIKTLETFLSMSISELKARVKRMKTREGKDAAAFMLEL